MTYQPTFDEVLDAVEAWPADLQNELVDVIRRRLAEQGRKQVVQDVQDARLEFSEGSLNNSNVDDIIREIESRGVRSGINAQ